MQRWKQRRSLKCLWVTNNKGEKIAANVEIYFLLQDAWTWNKKTRENHDKITHSELKQFISYKTITAQKPCYVMVIYTKEFWITVAHASRNMSTRYDQLLNETNVVLVPSSVWPLSLYYYKILHPLQTATHWPLCMFLPKQVLFRWLIVVTESQNW